MATRAGHRFGDPVEVELDHLVLDAIGMGWEQTLQRLLQGAPDFPDFERWILETTGGIPAERVGRINAVIGGTGYPDEIKRWLADIDAMPPVLSAGDLAHWNEHGYVILREAVPAATRDAAAEAIWRHLGAEPDKPDSWYPGNDHGIMVQYFQHPAFDANRRCPRVHKAFAQLWGTADLWVSTDRVGFNPPEREGWKFRGPDLHWDVSLKLPIPFGTQGILYLTDTPGEQGAFTCVPGFQNRVENWLAGLPSGANPRQQDLHALGSKPIAGRAGDLVIWHQALPHGSRPNRGTRPRIVQYINMYPTRQEVREEWI